MSSNFDREISFDIVEHIGVITTYSTGWNKEINLVSWNGAGPKYDIREWSPDHAHMSRGVTLHEKEMRTILDLIRNRNRRSRYDGTGGGNGSANRPGREDAEKPEAYRTETDRAEDEVKHSVDEHAYQDDHRSISCADDAEAPEDVCEADGSECGYTDEMNDVF